MPRFGLLAARLVGALPDLHRVGPYWRVLRAMRRRTLQSAGVSIGNLATIHERVHIDRRVAVTIGDRVDISCYTIYSLVKPFFHDPLRECDKSRSR